MRVVTEVNSSVTGAGMVRVILLLITAWSLLAGLALLSAGDGPLAIADEAGQRLAGAQMLVLAPLYLLIAWKPNRYGALVWLPFCGQSAMCGAIAYSIVVGDTSFADGILAVAISGVLAGLLGVVWISEQRGAAVRRYEAERQQEPADEESAYEDGNP